MKKISIFLILVTLVTMSSCKYFRDEAENLSESEEENFVEEVDSVAILKGALSAAELNLEATNTNLLSVTNERATLHDLLMTTIAVEDTIAVKGKLALANNGTNYDILVLASDTAKFAEVLSAVENGTLGGFGDVTVKPR